MDRIVLKDDHQQSGYVNGQWVGVSNYHSPQIQSPAHEYPGFGYPASNHGLGLDTGYDRPMPFTFSAHPSAPPLPATQWPSMLTNPSSNMTGHVPIMALPQPQLIPLSTYVSPQLPPVSTPPTMPTARRTLTDQDRRQMCQYHEDNPTVKQTEIGAMFGVERSTVSKVLRQKDKYLYPDDGSRSPVRKSKGKFPDIEKALSNWAKNHQKQGLPLNDDMIRDKALFFANSVGGSESHHKVNSSNWLERFKQKNHLLGCKPSKADSNDSDSGVRRKIQSHSGSQTPSGISPVSPSGTSSTAMSPRQNHCESKAGTPDGYVDFSSNYRHGHSQSATSLLSSYPEATPSSTYTRETMSPSSPLFSPEPDAESSPFAHSQQSSLDYIPNASNTARPRSQTFPMLGIDPNFLNSESNAESVEHKWIDSPALETPLEEMSEHSRSLREPTDPKSLIGLNTQSPFQTQSPGSMAPPPLPNADSPVSSASKVPSPIGPPPSQDEAREALELVMNFVQHQPNGAIHPQEYQIMTKLMERLRLQGRLQDLPGGMHSLHGEERDMGRKRSIHSL